MLGAACITVTLVGQARKAKGLNSERELTERHNAGGKPLCHASDLVLCLKVWDKKAIAIGKALSWRQAEHARGALQPLSLQPKWGAKLQSEGTGLQGSDSRPGTPWELSLMGPQSQGRSSGPIPKWDFTTSWDRILLDAGMDTHHTSITSKLILNQANMDGLLLGCFSPWAARPGNMWALVPWVSVRHDLCRAQGRGQVALQRLDPEEGQLWVLAKAKLVLHKFSGGSGWPS